MIHIKVTSREIDNGIQRDAESCPIALAIKTGTSWTDVIVGDHSIYVGDGCLHGESKEYDPPLSIQSWIQQFDTDKTRCKPFSFDIDLEAGTVLNCSLDSPGEASEGLQGASPASDTPAE